VKPRGTYFSNALLREHFPCNPPGVKRKKERWILKRPPLGGDKFILYNATSKYTKKF